MNPTTRYSEYWAYLRHAESLRFQVVGALTAIGAASLAFGSAAGVDMNTDERLWLLIGYGLLVGLAGLYLVAHKHSYDRYTRLMRRYEPWSNRKPYGVLQDAFTWLLGMMTVLGGGVVVASHLVGYKNSLRLGRVSVAVPLAFMVVWWAWYAWPRIERFWKRHHRGRST